MGGVKSAQQEFQRRQSETAQPAAAADAVNAAAESATSSFFEGYNYLDDDGAGSYDFLDATNADYDTDYPELDLSDKSMASSVQHTVTDAAGVLGTLKAGIGAVNAQLKNADM